MRSASHEPSARRWELYCLALLALIFFIRFPVNFSLHPPYLMDFEVYRAVAQRVARGDAANLYDPTASELMPFKYAPCWALLWLPLAWVPDHPGAVLWASLTVLWLILGCWGSVQLCRMASLRAPPWLALAVVSILARPLTAEFLNGQVDVLWGLLVIACLLAERSQRPWWAATWLALAVSLKLPALIVPLYLLMRGRLRTVARVLVVFLTINLATGFLLDPLRPLELFQRWMTVLWMSGTSRAFEIGNQSLLALLGRFLSADRYHLNVLSLPPVAVFGVGLLASITLFALVLIRPRSQPLSTQSCLVFDGALLTVLMVLCSPTVWIATYSALLFPVTLAIACAMTQPRATWRHAPSAATALAMLTLSVMTHSKFWQGLGITSFRGESYVFLVLMILPWFGLALFAYLWSQRQVSTRFGLSL